MECIPFCYFRSHILEKDIELHNKVVELSELMYFKILQWELGESSHNN